MGLFGKVKATLGSCLDATTTSIGCGLEWVSNLAFKSKVESTLDLENYIKSKGGLPTIATAIVVVDRAKQVCANTETAEAFLKSLEEITEASKADSTPADAQNN